ncbi:MAG: flagellar brake domain-containing protein [Desulfocapsaceae bacterium]|nr:flagellar brake domain-containing protein [Desulfocapsaceae bacterium]
MKKLLIIEDDYAQHDPIAEMCAALTNRIEIHRAANELQALKALHEKKIELVICDLSSGYGLRSDNLAGITYKYPYIPCLAVINQDQHLEEDVLGIGVSACLTAPLEDTALRKQLHNLLRESTSGKVRGIPVHSLLQMFEGDEKTCTLKIESEGQTGYIYMEKGVPVAAETGDQLNEDAIYSIVAWEDTIIDILHYNGQRSNEIQQPLLSLIIEAFRLKDERESLEEKQQSTNKPKLQLQHVSTAGNSLAIEMGAKIKIEIEGVEAPLSSTMVGMVPNQYLLITAPNPSDIVDKAREEEDKLVVKYLHLGRLCMFRTKILDQIESPKNLLFLEYPPVIHFHELRQAKRTSIFVPATLLYGGERELNGVLIDLSSLGCLYVIKVRGNGSLPFFDIETQVELRCLLPGISENQVLKGKVRNLKKSATELRIGIEFEDLGDDLKEAIDNYVFSVESAIK